MCIAKMHRMHFRNSRRQIGQPDATDGRAEGGAVGARIPVSVGSCDRIKRTAGN